MYPIRGAGITKKKIRRENNHQNQGQVFLKQRKNRLNFKVIDSRKISGAKLRANDYGHRNMATDGK